MVSDGARLREEFLLDPSVTFLNHGSFGATPRAVFERYQEWQLELERQPVLFIARRLDALLAEARGELGAYVGADPDDLVFVQNAGAAVNIAAWPLDLQPGDEVLSTDLEYGALDLTWEHVCGDFGARYVRTPIRLPVTSAEEICETVWAGVGPRTRALFLSHHTSSTAMTLPVGELCGRAREAGIRTIVDGAHAPAHLPLNLRELDADFYAGNCHKWLCAPKGAGFLYVRRELIERLEPPFLDLHAAEWLPGGGYEVRGDARRFENWESYCAGRVGLGVAVDYALEWGLEAIRDRVCSLAELLRERLGAVEGVAVHDLGLERCAIVTFSVAGHDPEAVARALSAERVNVSVSPASYSRLDLDARGLDALVRASVHYYNTEEELERMVELLRTRSAW